MASVFSEGFESGTNGSTITTSNTTYSLVNGTGTAIFDSSVVVAGSLSAKFTANGTTTINLREIFSGGSVTGRYFRRFFSLNALPPSSTPLTLMRIRLSNTTLGQVVVTSAGKLVVKDANTIIATSTNSVSLNSWFRVEWHVDGTVSATQATRIFLGANYNGSSPTETLSGSYSGGAFDRIEDGIGTSSFTGSVWLDEVDDDDTTWPGPSLSADQPPIANAGANQSVASQQLVTLNGSGSTDADGTVASYSWTQLTGTTVSLSDPTAVQPTFAAPTVSGSPVTLSFGLIVTDNLGVQSSQSTVTVTVNPPPVSAFSEDFENGSTGAVLTTSNTTYSSITGTPTFDNLAVVSGTLGANLAGTGSNTVTLVQTLTLSTSVRYFRRYFRFSALPTGSMTLVRLRLTGSPSTTIGQLIVNATGTLQLRDGTTIVATSTHTLTLNTWFRVEWAVDGTTTHTQTLKIFLLGGYNSGTADETISGSFTAGAFNQIEDGIGTTSLLTGTVWVDGVADSTTAYLGPMASANQAPTANAGTNQTVAPFTTVTLDGSGSTDVDGSVQGYLWAQTSGNIVTLSSNQVVQPTFAAPSIGTTMIFSLVAIDDKGAGSNTSTVTVTDSAPAAAFNESFEGGSNGATITSGNVSYGIVTGTATFDNSIFAAGAQSGKMIGTGTTTTTLRETLSSNVTSRYLRRYFRLSPLPTGSTIITLMRIRLTGTTVGQVVIIAGGLLQLRDANTVVSTSATSVLVNAWFRLEWFIDGTTTNTQTLRIYTGNLLNSAVKPTETLSGGYSQGAFNRIEDGVGTAGYTGTLWIDEAQDQTSNWPGPAAGTNQPPIVSAGASQTVLPADTVTLDGTGSVDPDGTIASYAWSQVSGTTVTLSSSTVVQPTFTAPTLANGDTLIFNLIVTDNTGATSQVGSVTITVQPCNEFVLKNGTWQVFSPNAL